MPLIPEHVLDEIQSRADIAEVIGRYVPLKRTGRHFKALCPFHKERTPSFHINTEKQIFHCFGCGVGGNLFSFLMQQERLTFPEAVRQVAEQVGVSIPTQPQTTSNGHTAKLLSLLEKTCQYYERLLVHPHHGRAAREYLRARGVTARARGVFRLGTSHAGWDGLIQAANKSRIDLKLLEEAGLIVQGARGAMDRFRQRLLFPIQDVRGRVLGFGGRSLAGQEPKYMNSPDTPIYHKGRHLFGLFQAKEAIAKANLALVVEGYFDCVMLWQADLSHVVSPLGTALTPEQARLLLRYTNRVVLAFDADAAGEAATLRGIDVLVEEGFEVRVAQLPAHVDPDELVRRGGQGALQPLIAKALTVVDFLLACATTRYNLRDVEEKVHAAQFILPTIAKIPNAMRRTEYVRRIAERLRLDEGAVAEELQKVKPRSLQLARPLARSRSIPAQGAERLLVALILDEPTRWDAIKGEPFVSQFSDERLRQIVAVVGELREAHHGKLTPAQVISRLNDETAVPGLSGEPGRLVSELVQLGDSVSNKDGAFQDCIKRLQASARKRQLDQLSEQIKAAEQGGQDQEIKRLLLSCQQLVKSA